MFHIGLSHSKFGINKSETATLRELPIQIFNHLFWKSWEQMSQPTTSMLLLIPRRLLPLSFLSWSWSLRTWRSISLSKYRYWMIRVLEEGSERRTINQLLVWSHSSVRCPWDWMKVGTRFSSTCLISQGEPMVQTTLRPSVFRFMQTAELEESISLIDSTQKMSYLQNSSFSCQLQENLKDNEQIYPPKEGKI